MIATATICTPSDILARLAEPFPPANVQWKPGATAGNRAMALPYLNASAIQDRLDAVLGTDWEARYEFLASGAVLCCLRVKIGDEWRERCDVGQCGKAGSENAAKQGVSDAFKRAARAWGLGRYLTRVPKQWVAYDGQKKRFTEEPKLPPWALSANAASARPSAGAAIAAAAPARPAAASPVPADDALLDLSGDEDEPDGPRAEQAAAVRITDNQERQLVELLRGTGADVGKFCKHFAVRSVGSLSQADFPKAVQLLRRKAVSTIGQAVDQLPARDATVNGVGKGKGTSIGKP